MDTWLTDFGADWEVACGGKPAYGPLGKFLKPLVKEHGAAKVREHWRNYLSRTPVIYCSPAKFAQTFGNWGNEGLPRLSDRQMAERSLAAWATDGL